MSGFFRTSSAVMMWTDSCPGACLSWVEEVFEILRGGTFRIEICHPGAIVTLSGD